MLPRSLQNLIAELAKLPGVGKRGAERIALGLIAGKGGSIPELRDALTAAQDTITICKTCGYFAEEGECLLCTDRRDMTQLMVVERAVDVMALENAGGYRGNYHVLGGSLSPLKGITPAHLRMKELAERLRAPDLRELILATSASVEGDATALYIAREIDREDLTITRLGRGVPMGGALEFADAGTLRMAFEGRRGFDSAS